MKSLLFKLLTLAIILPIVNCSAQQVSKDNIEGIWKGTSLCQVKPSACHDENVVYHISRSANAQTYTVRGNKIVNGAEEEMGVFDFVYDATKHTLTATMKDNQGRASIWLFEIDGKQMHGTLTHDNKTLFRIIELKKAE
jgi:hypothetical protein